MDTDELPGAVEDGLPAPPVRLIDLHVPTLATTASPSSKIHSTGPDALTPTYVKSARLQPTRARPERVEQLGQILLKLPDPSAFVRETIMASDIEWKLLPLE
jgi:hypothetical protein